MEQSPLAPSKITERQKPICKRIGLLIFNTSNHAEPKLLLMKDSQGLSPQTHVVENGHSYEDTLATALITGRLSDINNVIEVATGRKKISQTTNDWRVFSAKINGQAQAESSDDSWYDKRQLDALADRTLLYKQGKVSQHEWEENLGLSEEWIEFFQELGILSDPEHEQGRKIPIFLRGRRPIAGRYYGEEYKTTQKAAQAFADIGVDAYPVPNAESITIKSMDGDTFSFLAGNQLVLPPYKVQNGFFREIKASHDIPMANGYVYVALHNGYLGRTASIEVAYAMAHGKRIIFSETPTRFSTESPEEIITIVKDNYRHYPILPIDEIGTNLPAALEKNIERPNLSPHQRQAIFSSVLGLIRDLGRKYGTSVDNN
ncbi:MAG TPA: hypothetical protein VN711_03365 [Candidatus Saccharimonadales bacterium]|nr:hypothetical protein [Candidatus Saccharimonadales bacterium]